VKILFLSPQPYYQDRGTAIAIELLIKVMSNRGEDVDLLTFHVGEDRIYENVKLYRISPYFRPKAIKPGFSISKVLCDLYMLRDAHRMMRQQQYDLIHAVEEASFIALLLNRIHRVPFVVDMDSLMSAQLVDRFGWLKWIGGLLRWAESRPMKKAAAVVPMCEDLAVFARRYCPGIVSVLKDVSLISNNGSSKADDLRSVYNIEVPILMYVGNLEEYQGIDLLLSAVVRLSERGVAANAIIIGGNDQDIERYTSSAEKLGIDRLVIFTGPRPVSSLGSYLRQADVLVSPRIRGTNTPMKIYSYLDSGVPVVATALPTHTQVMSSEHAELVSPDGESMAHSIAELLRNPEKSRSLALNAKELVAREHSLVSFEERANRLYDEINNQIQQHNGNSVVGKVTTKQ